MSTETKNESLAWLLEPADMGVRYLALRDLAAASSIELAAAQKEAHIRQNAAGGILVKIGCGV
jgi:hypothetical protein